MREEKNSPELSLARVRARRVLTGCRLFCICSGRTVARDLSPFARCRSLFCSLATQRTLARERLRFRFSTSAYIAHNRYENRRVKIRRTREHPSPPPPPPPAFTSFSNRIRSSFVLCASRSALNRFRLSCFRGISSTDGRGARVQFTRVHVRLQERISASDWVTTR